MQFSLLISQVSEDIIMPINQVRGDYFGKDVAISDNFAFVSFDSDVASTEKGGRVGVFKYGGDGWVETQILHRPTQTCDNVGYTMNHSFGTVIDADGDWLVVGSPLWKSVCGVPTNGKIDGTVFVYKRNGDLYNDYQVLPSPDNYSNQRFGNSVSISGDWLFVGSSSMKHTLSSGSTTNGAVYVYKYNSGTGNWEYKQKLFDNNNQARSYGTCVAVDGERALVSNADGYFYYSEQTYYSRGIIYSYILNEGVWGFDDTFEYYDGSLSNAVFGRSLSISGDVAVVGAYQPRAASIYQWEDGKWEYKQTFQNSAVSTFGEKVVAEGDYVLIGASTGTVSGGQSTSGFVNVYHFENDEWVFQEVLVPSDAIYGGSYGISIAMDQGNIIVGSPMNTSGTGRSYIYFDSSSLPTVSSNFSSSSVLIEMDEVVDFTDLSVANNTDIISWSWDFDNDGVEDSDLQNPTYQFQYPGIQKVKLTVSDGEISSTKVKLVTVLSASESMCYSYIPFVGLGTDEERMGAAAWNVISVGGDEPEVIGHFLQQPPASIEYAYYYLASRDYGDIDGNSTGSMHATEGMSGWPNFYQALQNSGLSAEDITISFGLMTLGNDAEGFNWGMSGNREWRTYTGGTYYIKVVGETIIGGDMPNFDMDIEYNLYLQQEGLNDMISGDTGYADAYDGTNGGSSQVAKDLAAAFLLDCDGSKIKFKFSSLQPAFQFEFTKDTRYGGFFDIEQGFLMKECPKGGVGTDIAKNFEDNIDFVANNGSILINNIPTNSSVSVVNLSGSVVNYRKSISGNYEIIGLDKGVYTVIVNSQNERVTKKIAVK